MSGYPIPSIQFLAAMAREASAEAARVFSDPALFHTEWKSDDTPVTAADLAVHKIVTEMMATNFAHIPIVGEEGAVGSRTGADDEIWLSVDEVDGTSAFTLGIPVFTTLVALMRGEHVIKSVISDPVMRRTYSAEIGMGATLNDRPVSVCRELPRNATIGVASWPESGKSDMLLPRMVSGVMRELHDRGYHLMEMHSIAYIDAMVASGLLAGTIFAGDKVHDTAAADLLVREAGGVATDLWGNPLRYGAGVVNGHVYACNATVHSQLLDIVRRHDNRSRHQFP